MICCTDRPTAQGHYLRCDMTPAVLALKGPPGVDDGGEEQEEMPGSRRIRLGEGSADRRSGGVIPHDPPRRREDQRWRAA